MKSLRSWTYVIGASITVFLFAAVGTAASTAFDPTTVTLRPTADATVIDSNNDGQGDWVYDGLGSAVVGYGHPALGPGEDRGVFEFPLSTVTAPGCIATASLTFRVPGTNGDWSHDYALFAGRGDGSVTASDYRRTPAADRALNSLTEQPVTLVDNTIVVDVTNAIRRASVMMRTPGFEGVRFVLRQAQVTIGVVGSILVGTKELEDAYGQGFTIAARLTITYTC